MSLFAAIDSRTHKLLTSSRPEVRSAWVLSRGILARKDFQNSGSASAAKGGGLGGTRTPHLVLGQGSRREASTRRCGEMGGRLDLRVGERGGGA